MRCESNNKVVAGKYTDAFSDSTGLVRTCTLCNTFLTHTDASCILRTDPASPISSMQSALFWASQICKLSVQQLLNIRTPADTLCASQVRAQNLQDLIYKRGQAGITRASVTIVFDNSDKSSSPPGRELDKQVTVTRTVNFTLEDVPYVADAPYR